jgi:predicted dithiol-disulfide oxidoreductase (DUF899 family)
VEKDYRFATDGGEATLADLFGGRSQLIVYHFMFGPDFTAGCPSCSSIADGFNGIAVHLQHHDVAFWAVSRAQLAKLQGYKQRMGWSFPWASAHDTDFNFDFQVGQRPEQQEAGAEYNFRTEDPWRSDPAADDEEAFGSGADWRTFHRERPGMSAFVRDGATVYHTYSAYARGLDGLWGMYQWLDRAPLGRNEDGMWFRRHDEYDD